ncbi:PF20097 family protein [Youngiibacter multivorans]|uniref:Zn-ribbon and HTH transcriptional regulator n=1 Tax=Youngiibacter multivorans TaxID=937251 RepID=A0ABS4G7I1_9CLOT|nr:PF20097 family protein [Youngiibacter multivorans]MBP1920512.1 putative Zn-ribbon and HTH transcriptional regulator [Youngiibacter multivorans]
MVRICPECSSEMEEGYIPYLDMSRITESYPFSLLKVAKKTRGSGTEVPLRLTASVCSSCGYVAFHVVLNEQDLKE